MKKRATKILILAVCVLTLMTGCERGNDLSTRVVFTTGFEKDEIFRIESLSCRVPEIMVYLTNTQNQYEQVYGTQIWETDLEGVTLEENVKDTVLAKIAQIKSMNLLAKEHKVSLDGEEEKLVEEAAQSYFSSLNETEISNMQVTQETIEAMYREYATAEKIYYDIIKDINPEISDDEARTITIEQILIKTYTLNGSGERIPYTGATKEEAYAKIQEVERKLKQGEAFETLSSQYNEDSKSIYSFGKGEADEAYEKVAFNLGKDEISDIVETEDGYHIIKCTNTFNREETDANKVKIVEQRKKEVFGQEYDHFVLSLNKNLNKNLWTQITLLHDEKIRTADFFDVYEKYLGGLFEKRNTGL